MMSLSGGRGDDESGPDGGLHHLMAAIHGLKPRKRPVTAGFSPGTLHIASAPKEAGPLVLWMAAAVDGEHLLIVPLDDHPLAGPGDVLLDQGRDHQPLVARPAMAVWVPGEALAGAAPAGSLSEPQVLAVLEGVRASLPPSGGGTEGRYREADDQVSGHKFTGFNTPFVFFPGDPDLHEHLRDVESRLAAMVESSRARLGSEEREAVPIPLRVFRGGYPEGWPARETRLAAAGVGGLAEKLGELELSADEGVRTHSLDLAWGGTLYLIASEEGVLPAVRVNAASGSPPVLHVRPDGTVDSLDWEHAGGLLVASRRLPWRGEGRLLLKVDDDRLLEITR
jgi:hypothetical protein